MAALTFWNVAVLAIAVSACRLTARLGTQHPASASATTSSAGASVHAEASASSPRSTTSQAGPTSPPGGRNGMIYQAEMEALVGLTPAQARQRLKEIGHTGQLSVEELRHFDPRCKQGTVCSTSDEGGTFLHEDIVLLVNKAKLEIAAPPP